MNFRKRLLVLVLFSAVTTYGQDIFPLMTTTYSCIRMSENLPETLTSSRSAVILSVPEGPEGQRGNWKKLAQTVHPGLRKMGIDAIAYIYKGDLTSGVDVMDAYAQVLIDRHVEYLIFIDQPDGSGDFSLVVAAFNQSATLLNPVQNGWVQTHGDLNGLILELGRKIVRQNIPHTNFLIPEAPDYLDEVRLFAGLKLENFPGQLRRARLGVVRFPKAELPETGDEQVIEMITQHNLEVERQNQELEAFFEHSYPYKYELIDYGTDEELYKAGFQFVLMPVHSTGAFIKKVLNFETSKNETDYISMVPKEQGGVALKTLPVGTVVWKYYIKQVIAHDVHVGKQWDADTSWQAALQNYTSYLERALAR